MRCFVLLITILLFLQANAKPKFKFDRVNIEDGLANNSVRAIFQDNEGYLWFGTLNGLSRYDGKQFKSFVYDLSDSTTISNNKIRDIFQDGVGYIWVTTYDNNAHRFDPKTETFINFPVTLGEKFEEYSIHFLYESSPGVIWMSLSGNGCIRLTEQANSSGYSFKWFSTNNFLASDNITSIWSDKNDGIWIGTSRGTTYLPDDKIENNIGDSIKHFFVNKSSGVVAFAEMNGIIWVGTEMGEIYRMTNDKPELIWEMPQDEKQIKGIRKMQVAASGDLYIASEVGLLIIDSETGKIKHYNESNSGLNSNYVMSFYLDSKGSCWLVTGQRGVTRFTPRDSTFRHYPLNPEIRQSILEGEKQVFLEDRYGNLWVGIYGGGISRFDHETETFEQFLHEKNNPASLSSNLILSLSQDRSGNIWAGTYKRGLTRISVCENNFYPVRNTNDSDFNFLNEIRAVFEDSRGWIWAGDKGGIVSVYNQDFEKLFDLNKLLEKKINTGVYAFEEDSLNNIWIGTKGEGLFVLTNLPDNYKEVHSERIKIHRYSSKLPGKRHLSHNDVFDLHFDNFGQMWVALYHGGICVIQEPLTKGERVINYKHDDIKPNSLSDNRVRCLMEDHEGNMWIGTAFGLNFLESVYLPKEDKKFINIVRTGDPNSLSYNDVICMFEDSNRQVWVGTFGGGINKLTAIKNDSTFYFSQIGKPEGISSNLILSIIEDHDKALWISTDYGLNRFSLISKTIEKYYIADGLDEDSFSEGQGIFTSGNKVVFGHISGLTWFIPHSIKKSEHQVPVVLTNLKINGEDHQTTLNKARQIMGDSTRSLQLKSKENFLTFEFAALDYKAPSKVQYAFKLDGYESNWNNVGNLNSAIYRELPQGDYVFRLKASNSDGLWVNPEMKLHLSIAPSPWKTTWAYSLYLVFSVILLFILQRSLLERVRLKHEVHYEQQLTDEKLKFYTSISHEFKTPLALISGPIEDLLSSGKLPPEMVSSIKMMHRNTRRLQSLIDQLMDFRKIQKGFYKTHETKGDIVPFLKEVYQAFAPLAKKQNIRFVFVKDIQQLTVVIDYKSLEKIVFNLLSNAFKHVTEGKTVKLQLVTHNANGFFEVQVHDEGGGIHEDDIDYIFERFNPGSHHSGTNDETSTGIGLSLCSELAEVMRGEILVESKWGYGSCFKVVLPVKTQEVTEAISDNSYTNLDYTKRYIDVVDNQNILAVNHQTRSKLINNEKVLIIEDNVDLQQFLSNRLMVNYNVIQAFNGVDGLELANKMNPDIIICDIMMPKMNGLELTQTLKNEFRTSHIPIILLTAKSLEEHKIQGLETGADDYIVKPFNMVYLEKRIENLLLQRKKLRERFKQDTNTNSQQLSTSKADNEFIEKVIGLINENITDSTFSVDKLLGHFNFGRTVFYKKMKGITGYPPKDFIRIIRMKKAGELLHNPEITVSEVAFDTGYNDPEYFSKLFKKHFGVIPSEYQKKATSGNLQS
jgi:signal transduction histidine kinase/ligand-binding sensor domain-containing protein/DNA-binding response OmpR family regulator